MVGFWTVLPQGLEWVVEVDGAKTEQHRSVTTEGKVDDLSLPHQDMEMF